MSVDDAKLIVEYVALVERERRKNYLAKPTPERKKRWTTALGVLERLRSPGVSSGKKRRRGS